MKFVMILLYLFASLPAAAAELKIATWNLNWLTTRELGDTALPADVKPRSAGDFALLAQYAKELNADIIAVEEVDGYAAASQLFPRDLYSVHMTRDHVVQRVGIAVRRGLHFDINPDLTALSEHHLRSGADITLHLGNSELRILAVHLKKGCRDTPMPNAVSRSCSELRAQIPPLAQWIAARSAEGIPFIILGDFNRWMGNGDTFLAGLRQAAPLSSATEGQGSPCWGRENFIDHILAGGPASAWMRPDTLRVLTYRETGSSWRDRLSDHCPVSVRFEVPE